MAHRRPQADTTAASAAASAAKRAETTPEDTAPPADPLRQLFMGRRRSKRSHCSIVARLEGTLGSVPATMLSISLHGALIELEEPAFALASSEGGLLGYGALLEEHATGGLVLLCAEACLRRVVQVVRLTVGSTGGDPVQVGLVFEPVLQRAELDALSSCSSVRLEPDRRSSGR